MRYMGVIVKLMKERQLTGLKRGDKVPFRPNVPNEEHTTQRKELAKIIFMKYG